MVINKFQKQIYPKCTKQEGLEIIYGAPTREEAERIKQGLAMPGGLRPESGPVFRWSCSNYGYVWGGHKDEKSISIASDTCFPTFRKS